jgi:hypothetical protein
MDNLAFLGLDTLIGSTLSVSTDGILGGSGVFVFSP